MFTTKQFWTLAVGVLVLAVSLVLTIGAVADVLHGDILMALAQAAVVAVGLPSGIACLIHFSEDMRMQQLTSEEVGND